jgi:hypothetical protein
MEQWDCTVLGFAVLRPGSVSLESKSMGAV